MSLVSRLLAVAALAAASLAAQSQTLRVGLAEDPDVLDPTLARTFVGRIVFASLCDKLFDIDEKLAIVPQLATGYEWSRRQQDADDQAAQRRHLPRRREARRGGRQVQHRAPQDDGRLEPERRAAAGRERRRRRPDDGQAQPLGAVHADPRRARRSRRHDGVAEGGQGRGRELRRQAGVLGPVQVRRARRPGPHRARALPGLLEQGQRPLRQGRLHADRRRDRAPRQPALGPVRRHRARRAVGHRGPEEGQEPEGRAHHRDRLPGHHDQRGKKRAGAEEPARQGRQGARGVRARARPRKASSRS